jgi:hypothetical protein
VIKGTAKGKYPREEGGGGKGEVKKGTAKGK